MYLMNHLVDQVYIFERPILGDGNVGSDDDDDDDDDDDEYYQYCYC